MKTIALPTSKPMTQPEAPTLTPPAGPNLRNVHVWFKPEQFALISQAAEALGLSVTAFVRSTAVQAARASGKPLT
jgi:hypothetical protein